MSRLGRSLLSSVLTALPLWVASHAAHASNPQIADPQPFDPSIDAELAAPARFSVPESAPSPEMQPNSATESIRPSGVEDLSAGASQRLIDDVEGKLPLGTTNTEFPSAQTGLVRMQQAHTPDGSAPLTSGFAMFKVPMGERFWLAGTGWQRELTPGIKAVVFGAEAKVGLSHRVDLRMGYELLGTNPEQFGLTTDNHSDDSLYAQFRFRF